MGVELGKSPGGPLKWFGCERLTDTQTDRTGSITSSTDTGCNKNFGNSIRAGIHHTSKTGVMIGQL